MPCAPAPWASCWPPSGLSTIYQCLSCTRGPQTGHIILYKVSWVSRGENSHFLWPAGFTLPNTFQYADKPLLPQDPLLICSTCCSPGLPAPFLVSHHQASWLQPVLLRGVNPAQVQDLHFPLLNFKRFLMAHFSSLSRFWMAALPSSILTTLPNLISSANLLRVHYRLLPK